MPPKGWKKWTEYHHKGKRLLTRDEAVDAVVRLKWMGFKQIKKEKSGKKYIVYHGWN
jgi:hypothetical protein